MKLYLSSYRIPDVNALVTLVGVPIDQIKVAVIPNAKDYYAERAQNYKLQEILSYQQAKGFVHSEVVDLRGFTDETELKKRLSQFHVVWAVGGNTFCLRQEIKRSGFDNIIHSLLEDGIVYAGDSAGAIVAGTSLRGIESADIPEFAEKVIYDGMALVPKVIIPHADNQYFQESNQNTKSMFPANKTTELTDAQALVIHGKDSNIVTADIAEIS
ncbi:MAG: peptidase E [Actinobacteria bacterium]|nr:peptidase E [Actinomycetota bacterium]